MIAVMDVRHAAAVQRILLILLCRFFLKQFVLELKVQNIESTKDLKYKTLKVQNIESTIKSTYSIKIIQMEL